MCLTWLPLLDLHPGLPHEVPPSGPAAQALPASWVPAQVPAQQEEGRGSTNLGLARAGATCIVDLRVDTLCTGAGMGRKKGVLAPMHQAGPVLEQQKYIFTPKGICFFLPCNTSLPAGVTHAKRKIPFKTELIEPPNKK